MNSVLLALRTQITSPIFIRNAFVISVFYFIVSNIINEYAIYNNIFSQNFDLILKLKISVLMFWNNLTLFGGLNSVIMLVIAMLVGINVMLVIRKFNFLRSQKDVQWTFSAGIVSLASSSCPGCGFSLLSITGLSSAIPSIAFSGITLSVITLLILLATTFYNLRSLGISSCPLPSKQ